MMGTICETCRHQDVDWRARCLMFESERDANQRLLDADATEIQRLRDQVDGLDAENCRISAERDCANLLADGRFKSLKSLSDKNIALRAALEAVLEKARAVVIRAEAENPPVSYALDRLLDDLYEAADAAKKAIDDAR